MIKRKVQKEFFMGISLEDLLEELNNFEEAMLYYLTCVGKNEDNGIWKSKINILRDQILTDFGKR
jgi:hypothetical protein